MRFPFTTRTRLAAAVVLSAVGCLATPAGAGPTVVVGGRTTVALDAELLASAAGLTLDDPSPAALRIAPRDAEEFPTTFAFDPDDFAGTAAGKIDHFGRIVVSPAVEDLFLPLEDFTIFRDPARAGTLGGDGGVASGFYVANNPAVGPVIELFDLAEFEALSATATSLTIDADLLVAPEFAAFLRTNGLAEADLTGLDVGDVRVEATATAIPLPPAVFAMLSTVVLLGAAHRWVRGRA